jgi:hypothetical protein
MPIEVSLNENLRLAGALLAAGEWPEIEQKQKAYKPHHVAERAYKYFAPWREMMAVQTAQMLVGQGEGLNQLFHCALSGDWSSLFGAEVAEFTLATRPENFWTETDTDWQAAVREMQAVQARADLGQFLADLFGPSERQLRLSPNLLFPGQRSLALNTRDALIVYAPPPLAWGTSPPWRYDERPDEVQAMVSQAYTGFLFAEQLPGVNAEALGLAAAVLFLRQAEGDAAGNQFMVIQKKMRGWRGLPGVVDALASALAARREGKLAALADSRPELMGPLERLTG